MRASEASRYRVLDESWTRWHGKLAPRLMQCLRRRDYRRGGSTHDRCWPPASRIRSNQPARTTQGGGSGFAGRGRWRGL